MKKYVTQEELNDREDKVLRDGESMRFPLFLMDSAASSALAVIAREFPNDVTPKADPHARTLPLTDTEFKRRSDQIDAKNKSLSDAWKDIPALPPTEDAKPAPTGDVYERRDRRLEDAWRGAA